MRDKIFKFTVALRNYEDMYYREMCVQSKLQIKEFCYIILASFEALANDRLFVDEAKQPTIYIYDNLNLNDISKDVVECLGETKGQKFYLVFERGYKYIFDVQLEEVKKVFYDNEEEYPKITDGKGKSILPGIAPECYEKLIEVLDEKGQSKMKYFTTIEMFESWDYKDYDLEADNKNWWMYMNYIESYYNDFNDEIKIEYITRP